MDLVQVLDRLAKTAAEVLAAEAAEVLLLDERHSRLTIEAVFGLSRSNFGLDLGRAILDKGLPVIVQNAQTDPLGDHLPKVFHSALGVPLRVPGRPLGTLHVYGIQPAQFGPGEIERLQAVADLGAIAIETAQGLFDLESMDSSKSQFIRVATHELRSPITVAQSMLGTVVKGYAGPMTETQREIFARIAGRLNFLENLVNDLLQLAASKAPGFTEDECAVTVNASLGRVVLLLQPRAEEKGVALVHHACCDKLAVWASEEGLDRIFVNLVGNAVKYTPPGGRVDVWLGQSPGTPGQSPGTPGQSPGTPGQSPGTPGQSPGVPGQRSEQVWVRVADTGVGIPPEALPHLFEEFYRAPNVRASEIAGTGLGLAIVKDLVERYQGQIEVSSELGKGTTFTVTFPNYRGSDGTCASPDPAGQAADGASPE